MSPEGVDSDRSPLFSEAEWTQLCESLGLRGRQADVLQRVITGMTDKAIAADLGISPPTVRTYLQRLFQEFEVSDRTNLVICVFRRFRRRVSSN